MQKITPFLWFDNQAEEAAKFYTSILENSKVGKITRYGKEGHEIQTAIAASDRHEGFLIGGVCFSSG